MTCDALGPDNVRCTLNEAPTQHRHHLTVLYEGGKARHVDWPNPDWVDPHEARAQAAEQAATARETARTAARTLRDAQRRLARAEDPQTAKDAAVAYVAAGQHTTRLGKVAKYLLDHLGEWIDAVVFTDTDVGGFAGTRRLRELREEYGWAIETRRKPGSTTAWQHRLAEPPPTD